MDAIGSVLAAPRADGVFVLRSDLVGPWCIRLEDRAPLTVVVVARGTAVLRVDGDLPRALGAGDAVLVRGSTDYALADAAGTTPQAVIGPGQVCRKPDGSPLTDFRHLGIRAWGNVPLGREPETVLVTGTYERAHQVSRRLLDALPPTVVVPAGAGPSAVGQLVGLVEAEIAAGDAAQDVVLDRLVDLLAIAVLRAWFADEAHRPPWYAAYGDPVLGGVLRRVHHEPDRPWSLALLAREVGVSRATLARRFTHEMGEPVMTYLARWRVDVAADLLRSTDLTVEAVAARVGYGSGFALSNAFARHRGCSPTAFRRAAA